MMLYCLVFLQMHIPVPFMDETALSSWLYSWCPCWRSADLICVYLFLDSSIPLFYMSLFMPVSYCYNYCSFVIIYFEIMKCNASSFFFSRLFWLFQICYDFIWILEIFAIFIKKYHWNLERDCTEYVDHFTF